MSYEIALQRQLEWKRLYVEVELTEEGLFAVDEVPEDYAGSFIARVELVFATLHIDNRSRMRLVTYNPPDVQNKSREKGLPIQIVGGHEIRVGAKEPTIEVQWRENSNLDSKLRQTAAIVWGAMQTQIGEWKL